MSVGNSTLSRMTGRMPPCGRIAAFFKIFDPSQRAWRGETGVWFAQFSAYMKGVNIISVTVRLLLAVICGGLIGFERGQKKRAAGFRTHILVCLGSALAMMTNQYTYIEFGNSSSDVTRIGAQVISGIGFLGAGSILVTRTQQVKGLTTAAGLWASACMGLAIGIGFYQGAFLGCVFIFCVITAFHKIDDRVNRDSIIHEIYFECEDLNKFRTLITYLREHSCKIYSHEIFRDTNADTDAVEAIVSLKVMNKRENKDLIQELSVLEGVSFVEEIN